MKTNLQILRESNGLPQRKISVDLGITQQAYSRYERGDREPDLEMLCKLADYFGVSVDYLIGHESVKNPIMERPLSDIAENFIREFGELFSDETFQSYARLYKLMDARQRLFVLGMIFGWLKDQGINVQNI